MFWKHRVDLRELIQTINKLSETELDSKLSQITEQLAEKLEYASIFRKSPFPKKIRETHSSSELQSILEEVFEFANEERVWLGVETNN